MVTNILRNLNNFHIHNLASKWFDFVA
uniref:Uncharacterized protein n=1 Tax=Anguilla anguilla TaxID=7936 RepID=A0A0E9VET3_ANGAN